MDFRTDDFLDRPFYFAWGLDFGDQVIQLYLEDCREYFAATVGRAPPGFQIRVRAVGLMKFVAYVSIHTPPSALVPLATSYGYYDGIRLRRDFEIQDTVSIGEWKLSVPKTEITRSTCRKVFAGHQILPEPGKHEPLTAEEQIKRHTYLDRIASLFKPQFTKTVCGTIPKVCCDIICDYYLGYY